MGQLEVVADGRRYVFDTQAAVLCGRSMQAQVPLTDRRVGRVHARLVYEADAWYLIDADSTNGTWINGERISRQRIDHEVTAHLGNPKDGALLYVRPHTGPLDPTRFMAPGSEPDGTAPADPVVAGAPTGDVATPDGPMPGGPPAMPPLGRTAPVGPIPEPANAGGDGLDSTGGAMPVDADSGQPPVGYPPPVSAPPMDRSPYGRMPLDQQAQPDRQAPPGWMPPDGMPPMGALPPVGNLPPGGGLAPGGRPLQEGTLVVGATPNSAPVLVARLGTKTLIFPVGQPVRVGRDPELEAVTDHPLVSRNYHGLLTSDYGGATYTDSSSRGTYLNGRQLKAPLRITEPVTLRLGDPATGEELGVTPPLSMDRLKANQRRRVMGTRLKVLAGVIAAIVVIGGGATAAILLTRHPAPAPGAPTALSTALLHHAESATVRLLEGTTDNYSGWGSGTIISPDGLILTNAHVAAPNTPGAAVSLATPGTSLDPNPAFLTVEFTTSDASAAVPRYHARAVAVDGYLDLAVVQIFETLTGQPVDTTKLNLPYLKLGDVSKLGLDQNITILGFPGVSGSDSITVTSGTISTFIPDPLNHVKDPRFQMETTARVAHGNSGGAAITNNGELVGVPSLEIPGQGADLSWRLRSVTQAAPLIEAAKTGKKYTSNLLVPLSAQTTVTAGGIGTTLDQGCTGNPALPTGATRATFAFSYTGGTKGLDVAFLIQLPDGSLVRTSALQEQSVPGLPEASLSGPTGCLGYTITAGFLSANVLPDGVYQTQLLGGPNFDPLGPVTTLRIGA